MEKALESFKQDSQDWRAGLGRRLDRQDKLLWGALVGCLLASVSVVGFLVAHLPMFAR